MSKELWCDAAITYNNEGHAKYLKVDFNAAIEDYSNALKINPKLAVAYYNRGTIYYRLGQHREAVADMKQAILLEPTNAEFCEGLRDCMKFQNRLKC